MVVSDFGWRVYAPFAGCGPALEAAGAAAPDETCDGAPFVTCDGTGEATCDGIADAICEVAAPLETWDGEFEVTCGCAPAVMAATTRLSKMLKVLGVMLACVSRPAG